VTISINSKEIISFGNRMGYIAEGSLSGSYSFGGEGFNTEELFGIHSPDIVLIEPANGYKFQFDKANKKVKAFSRAPLIVYDEHQILDDDYQMTLKYPAAFLMNVAGAGNNIKLRSTGIAKASLGAGEGCLASQMAAGERTTLTVSPVNQITTGAIGDGTGWTAGTDWSFAAGKAVKAAGAASGTLAEDAFTPTVGHTYRVIYTVSGWTAGGVTPSFGGETLTAVTADGTYTEDVLADGTGKLTFTPASDASALSIDDVYIIDLDVYTTYVTQTWKDVWDNLVQDEAVTLTTGANNLDNAVLAMMYVDQTTATAAALTMVDEDDTVASGEVEVAFNVTTAQLTVHSAQNAKAAKVTYIKVPDSGFLKDRLVHNETATQAGGDPYTNPFDYPVLLWGYAGCAPVNTGVTQVLIDFAGTPAAGEGVVDWFNPGIRGAGAPAAGTVIGVKSNVTLTGAYVWGTKDEVPDQIDLEVPDGSTLSAIDSVRMIIIGS
jgi:hypothetical protein